MIGLAALIEKSRRCDLCSKLAMSWARDVVAVESVSPYTKYEMSPHIKKGCEDHPVNSETSYRTDLPFWPEVQP